MPEEDEVYPAFRRTPSRSPRRKEGVQPAGRLAGARLDALGIGDKVREHTAPLVWAELVGPQVAGATEAERVREGVLYVAARSATWAHELSFHKADILRRLNSRIGAKAGHPLITDIRFFNRGGNVKPPVPETAPALAPTRAQLEDVEIAPEDRAVIEADTAVITDENLRERVRRARLAGLRLQTWRMENGWLPCERCGELAPPHFPYDGTLDCGRCRMARASARMR